MSNKSEMDMLVSEPKTWKVEPDADEFIVVSADGTAVLGRNFSTAEDAQTVANCMHNITKLRAERDELVGALEAMIAPRVGSDKKAQLAAARQNARSILAKHKPE